LNDGGVDATVLLIQEDDAVEVGSEEEIKDESSLERRACVCGCTRWLVLLPAAAAATAVEGQQRNEEGRTADGDEEGRTAGEEAHD
jgi:hypothetical protein